MRHGVTHDARVCKNKCARKSLGKTRHSDQAESTLTVRFRGIASCRHPLPGRRLKVANRIKFCLTIQLTHGTTFSRQGDTYRGLRARPSRAGCPSGSFLGSLLTQKWVTIHLKGKGKVCGKTTSLRLITEVLPTQGS